MRSPDDDDFDYWDALQHHPLPAWNDAPINEDGTVNWELLLMWAFAGVAAGVVLFVVLSPLWVYLWTFLRYVTPTP